MSDFAIYWKNLAKDRARYRYGDDAPLCDWRTNSERLFQRLGPGGRLWFLASGAVCGGDVRTAAYLVNVFRVRDVVVNQGDDAEYPPEDFRYTVRADLSRCCWFNPPLLADHIVRPAGHDISKHIGKLLQGPRLLQGVQVAHLEALVRGSGRELV